MPEGMHFRGEGEPDPLTRLLFVVSGLSALIGPLDTIGRRITPSGVRPYAVWSVDDDHKVVYLEHDQNGMNIRTAIVETLPQDLLAALVGTCALVNVDWVATPDIASFVALLGGDMGDERAL